MLSCTGSSNLDKVMVSSEFNQVIDLVRPVKQIYAVTVNLFAEQIMRGPLMLLVYGFSSTFTYSDPIYNFLYV